MDSVLNEEWAVLAGLLPEGWRELARESGAIKRERGITDPEILLRLVLMHTATGLSLRQTALRARQQGLAKISDVGILKRLRSSGPWLEALTRAMFRDSRFGRGAPKVSVGRNIRVVDATTVEEPGATGTSWRVHYSLRLPDLVCDHYELTDVSGGETYRRFAVARGDVILGDRGYANPPGVAHVLRKGGDVVVRLNTGSFPLKRAKGGVFDVLSEVRKLSGHTAKSWIVQFQDDENKDTWHRLRLCAVRKSATAAAKAKRSMLKDAGKKKPKPETLELGEYVLVLTSLPSAEYSVSEVLELYRARWQIELAFKRLKSLLKLGHLPKTTDASARAWIEAKLLVVLLIERLLEEARSFSPWGFRLETSQQVARVHRRP